MEGTTEVVTSSFVLPRMVENSSIAPETVDHYWEDDMAKFLYAVPSTIFMIIGTIGNVLSFIIYSQKSMRKSVTSVYFRVLAISDTVVLFSGGLVFFIYGAFGEDIRLLSEASCKFWIPLLRISCYHSCWILVFIALDRFIGVMMPHRYRQFCTKQRALIMMAVWFFVVLITVFIYWAIILTIDNNACGIGKPYLKFFEDVYRWFDLVVLNLIPSATLVTVNGTIIVKLIRSQMNQTQSSKSSNIKSPTLILISVSIVYMLCTIPTSTAFIVIGSFHGPRAASQTKLYIRSCETLYLANHAVNFFLYCLHGTTFRRELANLFSCKAKKSLSTSSSSHGPSTELSTYRKRSDKDAPRY